MILFAYAGNMDVEDFAGRVPSAKRIGIGKLPGYKLTFDLVGQDESGKANVTPSSTPEAEVWGVLIEIDENEKFNFFNPDPDTNNLTLETLECFGEDGNIYQAQVFMAKPHAINTSLLPYDWYLERIINLATHAGLPDKYVSKLTIVPFKIDPNMERGGKRREKFRLK